MSDKPKQLKTWLQVAHDRGVHVDADGSINGESFANVGIFIVTGCVGCGASVAPYSSYQVDEDDYAYCADCVGVK